MVKKVTEPNNKSTHQPHGARGASSSGTLQYVVVVTAPAAATVGENAPQPFVPHKDVVASSLSFALQDFSDAIPQGVLPHSNIPVLELASDVAHNDIQNFEEERILQETRIVDIPKDHVDFVPPVYTVEHVDVHEEVGGNVLSQVREVSSSTQTTAAQADTMVSPQDLAAV